MPLDHLQLGRLGEKLASDHLRKSGYRILAANYSSSLGEIDLICFHDDTIVFVEVKALKADDAGDPEEHITPAKRRKIERTAREWLAAHRNPECAYRFDAVSVVIGDESSPPRVRHIVEAFLPSR